MILHNSQSEVILPSLFFFFLQSLWLWEGVKKKVVKVCFVCNNSVHSALSGLVGFRGWAEADWGRVRRRKFSDIDPLSSLWLYEELSFLWSPCTGPPSVRPFVCLGWECDHSARLGFQIRTLDTHISVSFPGQMVLVAQQLGAGRRASLTHVLLLSRCSRVRIKSD